MASPLDVGQLNAPYCSLFAEDKQFGSWGNFFELTAEQYSAQRWHIVPPFSLALLNAAARLVVNQQLRGQFIGLRNEEAEWVQQLTTAGWSRQVKPSGTYSFEYWQQRIEGSADLLIFTNK